MVINHTVRGVFLKTAKALGSHVSYGH